MLYNIMEPRFIFLLLLWGTLACAALTASVLSYYQRGARSPYILRTLSFLFAAGGFAGLFVSVTAYRAGILLASTMVSCVIFAAAAVMGALFAGLAYQRKLPLFSKSADFGKVIDAIDDPFLIFDAGGAHIAGNPPMPDGIKNYAGVFASLELSEEELFRGAIKEINKKYFFVTLSVITRGKRIAGRVLLFHDITEKHALMESIGQYHAELKRLNDVLEGEAAVDEEFFYQRERARLASKLEAHIGASIHRILSEADAAAGETDKQKQIQNFSTLAADIRDLLSDIRQIVRTGN